MILSKNLKVKSMFCATGRHSHLPARVVHLPNKKDQSHCGVFGYTGNDSTDELIAMKISQIARKDHMYPGTKSSDAI